MDQYGYQRWPAQGNGVYSRGGRGENRGGFRGGNRGGYDHSIYAQHVEPTFHQQKTFQHPAPQQFSPFAPQTYQTQPAPHARVVPLTPSAAPTASRSIPTARPFNPSTEPAAITVEKFDKWAAHIKEGLVRNQGTASSRLPVITHAEREKNKPEGLSSGVCEPGVLNRGIDRGELARRMKVEQNTLARHSDHTKTSSPEKPTVSEIPKNLIAEVPRSTSAGKHTIPTPPPTPIEKASSNINKQVQSNDQLPARDGNGFILGEAKLNRRLLPTLTSSEPIENDINPKTGKIFTEEEWDHQIRVRDHRRLERAAKRNHHAKAKNSKVNALLKGKDDLPAEEKIEILVKAFEENQTALGQLRDSHVKLAAEKDKLKTNMQRANSDSINYRNDLEQVKVDLENERRDHRAAIRDVENKLAKKQMEVDAALKKLKNSQECCAEQNEFIAQTSEDLRVAHELYAELEKASSQNTQDNFNLTQEIDNLILQNRSAEKQLNRRVEELGLANIRTSGLESKISDQSEQLQAVGEALEGLRREVKHKTDAFKPNRPDTVKADFVSNNDDILDVIEDYVLPDPDITFNEKALTVTDSEIIIGDITSNTAIDGKIVKSEESTYPTSPSTNNCFLSVMGVLLVSLFLTGISGFYGAKPSAVNMAPNFNATYQQLVFTATMCSPLEAPSAFAVTPIPTSTIATYTSAIPDNFFAPFELVIEVPDNTSFVEEEESKNKWTEKGICQYEEFPKVRKAIFTAVLAAGIHGIVLLSPILGP
ncbi:hypothetical protein ONS96_011633 [Cadophora gregata f. sp. sojae]|nr:hypothetical protein ONS96_011633 [Cadophora gregata f. sp. sojae]